MFNLSFCTFGSGSAPGTPISPGFPGGLSFPKSVPEKEDPAQQFIRARQREAEEQKKRMLAAYDYISKQGAGTVHSINQSNLL